MDIFGELVKRYWNGNIQKIEDLDVLANEISRKYGFSDSDMPFIKDHIRIAMGLNPNGEKNFNNKLNDIKNSKKISGVKECNQVLQELKNGKTMDYNFIEGMGCIGGCVGGPRTNIEMEKATKYVNDFGEDSYILTPYDNLNVMKILKLLGVNSVEEMVDNEKMNRILSRE